MRTMRRMLKFAVDLHFQRGEDARTELSMTRANSFRLDGRSDDVGGRRGVLALVLVVACAPALEASDDGTAPPSGGPAGAHVVHEDPDEDGSTLTQVNATDAMLWIYLDLETGQELALEDPNDDPAWDLAFQRFHIALNGGVMGSGDVTAAVLEDTAFADVTRAPADGYVSDLPDGDDDNEDPDYVFKDWYAYDFTTHVLTPYPIVYVIRTQTPNHYKVQLERYYDEAGSSGYPTFRWASVAPP